MKVFQERFKSLRLQSNISQKDIAKFFNTTNSGISDWENGRTEPNLEQLVLIADYFNVCSDYLIGRQEYY